MATLAVTAVKETDVGVAIYRASGETFCRFASDGSGKPDRRRSFITLNGYRWRLVWVNKAPPRAQTAA